MVLVAHTAIGLGTLAGGWRIIHTMGSKITKLQPVGGFAAETGAACRILIATQTRCAGVSTTHAITGAIVGVGATRRAVRGAVGRGAADRLGVVAARFRRLASRWSPISALRLAAQIATSRG